MSTGRIRVIMITGDHPRTARAIAARAGIDTTRILSGMELQQLKPLTSPSRSEGSACSPA